MKTIVHLSDLHFDAVDYSLVPALTASVKEIAPDILAISGDFTQHAYPAEFRAAMDFVGQLPGKLIVVPGNHDMSFYNPLRRATERLKLFREFVSNDPEPFRADDEVAILGLNTARVSHLRDGRIRGWQVKRLEERMATAPKHAIRVLVTHHPFDLPSAFPEKELVAKGREYLPRVVRCIDLMLAGHMHISHAGPTAVRFNVLGQSAIFVQAGTALSTRTRTETNSFQVIRLEKDFIRTQQYAAAGLEYRAQDELLFRREGPNWTPIKLAGQVSP